MEGRVRRVVDCPIYKGACWVEQMVIQDEVEAGAVVSDKGYETRRHVASICIQRRLVLSFDSKAAL